MLFRDTQVEMPAELVVDLSIKLEGHATILYLKVLG